MEHTIKGNAKKNLLGLYKVSENGEEVKYPFGYGYRVLYTIGAVVFVLSILDALLSGALFGGITPGIIAVLGVIALFMDKAVRKDLKEKQGIELEKYLIYKKKDADSFVVGKVDNSKVTSLYILTIVVTLVIFVFSSINIEGDYSNTSGRLNSGEVAQADIVQEVQNLKTSMKLPYKVDEYTTLIDITPQPNAIRYHYTVSRTLADQLSNSSIKSNLVSTLCHGTDTRALLNQGIGMEYSYVVSGTNQGYFVSITESDCSY